MSKCGNFASLFLQYLIIPVLFYQALEKVRMLEADNQGIEQVGFVFTLIWFMWVGRKGISQSKEVVASMLS